MAAQFAFNDGKSYDSDSDDGGVTGSGATGGHLHAFLQQQPAQLPPAAFNQQQQQQQPQLSAMSSQYVPAAAPAVNDKKRKAYPDPFQVPQLVQQHQLGGEPAAKKNRTEIVVGTSQPQAFMPSSHLPAQRSVAGNGGDILVIDPQLDPSITGGHSIAASSYAAPAPLLPAASLPPLPIPAPVASTSAMTMPAAAGGVRNAWKPGATGSGKGKPSKKEGGPKKSKKTAESLNADTSGLTNEELLATKWLMAHDLALIIESRPDLVIENGRFSDEEKETIKQYMIDYKARYEMDDQGMSDLIFNQGGRKQRSSMTTIELQHQSFWPDLVRKLPHRTLYATFHHVRRAYNPAGKKGKWTDAEQALLNDAYARHGTAWEAIAKEVGRAAGDCKDRYRHYGPAAVDSSHKTGAWPPEDVDELKRIVEACRNPNGTVPWKDVSLKFGKRTEQQCRIKWTTIHGGARSKKGKGDKTKTAPAPIMPVQHQHLQQQQQQSMPPPQLPVAPVQGQQGADLVTGGPDPYQLPQQHLSQLADQSSARKGMTPRFVDDEDM